MSDADDTGPAPKRTLPFPTFYAVLAGFIALGVLVAGGQRLGQAAGWW